MKFINWLLGKDKEDPEVLRRKRLLAQGRMTEGTIIDIETDDGGSIVEIYYVYNISGADYESSQSLDRDQITRSSRYKPGANITVRYDPGQPANSVVV
jgi:hypothetical protein